MRSKLRWGIFFGLLLVGVAAWFGIKSWRAGVVTAQRERGYEGVARLVADGKVLAARGAVREFWRSHSAGLAPAEARRWRQLEVKISEAAGDLARLVWLQENAPEVMAEEETASLLVLRTLRAAGQHVEADALRESWRGREVSPELWMAQEVDRYLARGEAEEARRVLEAAEFPGERDVGRRLRLALLAANPQEAWDELAEAMALNPRHPDVRTFRAQILERAGAVEDARVEWVAALVAAPDDPVRRDQLAQFYLRHGSPALAIQTWREGLTDTAPEFLWLRTLLWQRLWGGAAAEALPPPPVGQWTPLIEGLQLLEPGRFWAVDAVEDPAHARRSLDRPEVQLLQVLEALRQGNDREALEHVRRLNMVAEAQAALLVNAVEAVLRWRLTELQPQPGDLPSPAPGVTLHVVMQQLRAWSGEALPEETAALLAGPQAWSALMLGAGWPGAAIVMAGEAVDVPPAEAPDWYFYGMAGALRQVRGVEAALAYLAQAPARPVLRMQAAELQWMRGDVEVARETMRGLAGREDATGYRAAWLLAVDALEREVPAEITRWVTANAELAASITGQELLARAALAEGDVAGATEIYERLGPRSLEAGMMLAGRAYAAQEWAEARELVEALLVRFPSQVGLRANLEQIAEAEAAAGGE